jgi:hypothetical protein
MAQVLLMSQANRLLLSSAELLAARSIAMDRSELSEQMIAVASDGWDSLTARGLAGGSIEQPTMSPLLSQAVCMLYSTPMMAMFVSMADEGQPTAFSVHLGDPECSAIHSVDDDGDHHIVLVAPDAAFDFAKSMLAAGHGPTLVTVSVRREGGTLTDSFVVDLSLSGYRIFESIRDYESKLVVGEVDASDVWQRFGRCLAVDAPS